MRLMAKSITILIPAVAVGVAMWRRRKQRVIVVCAVEEEADHVKRYLAESVVMPLRRPARQRVRGVLEGRKDLIVDVVTCGVGVVDASMVVSALLLESTPACVLSVGCSGAHSKHIRPGDVVVSTTVVPTACKMLRHDGTSHHVGMRLNTVDPPLREIPTDPILMEAAMTAATNITLPAWPTTAATRPVVYRGKIGSSDTWSQCPSDITRQHTELGTLCEEMEAVGVSRVCQEFGVPCVCIKDIANNELEPPPDAEAETGLGESLIMSDLGRRAALVAVAMLQDSAFATATTRRLPWPN
mmetsp:Transcript_4078/g.10471  ORF Transcript_4078/g.10471 Transcript_4078/m.10471 type:complete len:299 (+) Transcript_4078:173-1069(+)